MPRVMSDAEYEELGRRYYKQKEYQKAIDAFTAGLDASSRPSYELLEYRAATYEKVDNLDAALRDGRRMIQLNKKCIKGYLRTGQILQKKEKLETALGIYEYGAKNVPVTDPNYPLLKSMRDKLERRLNPPKSLDPLTVLPVEIAEMILTYLTFKNIVNCLRVSGNWNRFIKSRTGLWNHMDLSHSKRLVPLSFIKKCITMSHSKLQQATLHRTNTLEAMRILGLRCKNLQNIDILSGPPLIGSSALDLAANAHQLRDFTIGENLKITLDDMCEVMRRRPTLANISFLNVDCLNSIANWKADFPNLRSFNISCEEQPLPRCALSETLDLKTLFNRAPGLRHIRIVGSSHIGVTALQPWDFSGLQDLETLELLKFTVPDFPTLPQSLKSLCIVNSKSGGRNRSWMANSIMEKAQGTVLPHLEKLDLSILSSLDIDLVYGLLALNSEAEKLGPDKQCRLRKLSLSNTMASMDAPPSQEELYAWHRDVKLFFSLPQLAELRELDLSLIRAIDDRVIAIILDNDIPLETINLSGANITGVSVKLLVNKLKKTLRCLTLVSCLNISSDAVDWARRQDIQITIHSGESKKSAKSGFRIREGY